MIDFIIRFMFITVLMILLLSSVMVPIFLIQTGHPILGFLSFPLFITGLITITED